MKNKILLGIVILIIVFGIFGILHGSITPSIGVSDTYAILSGTYTDTSGATTINGDVGFTTPPATAPLGIHTNYGNGAPYATAGIDQGVTLALLNTQTCDFTFGSATDLSLLSQPLTPGTYCVVGAQSIGTAGITLKSGTYIFRSTGALNTTANSIVSGGNSCDVFWTPVATTLGANSTFLGTVIDNAGITVGAHTTWKGSALSFGGTVTTDSDTITKSPCTSTLPSTTTPLIVPPTASTSPVVTTPPTTGGNGPIVGSYGTTTTQPTVSTSTPVCTPVTNFILGNKLKGDGQMELYWTGGDKFVTIWQSGVPLFIDNVGYYEARNLNNNINYWFWVTNNCSETIHIDPKP